LQGRESERDRGQRPKKSAHLRSSSTTAGGAAKAAAAAGGAAAAAAAGGAAAAQVSVLLSSFLSYEASCKLSFDDRCRFCFLLSVPMKQAAS